MGKQKLMDIIGNLRKIDKKVENYCILDENEDKL